MPTTIKVIGNFAYGFFVTSWLFSDTFLTAELPPILSRILIASWNVCYTVPIFFYHNDALLSLKLIGINSKLIEIEIMNLVRKILTMERELCRKNLIWGGINIVPAPSSFGCHSFLLSPILLPNFFTPPHLFGTLQWEST